jgi:hypothetical protein
MNTVGDMGCMLNGNSAIDVSVNDPKRTNITGVKLASGFVVKNQALFVTWLLVIVVTAFAISMAKVVIDGKLPALL